MAEQPHATSPDEGFAAQFLMMGRAFLASPERNRLLIICAALAVVIGGTAWAQVWLNAWNEPFYNALAARNLAAFMTQLGVFAIIAGILLVLNVAQTWLTLASKLKLRQGLVQDLFHEWLTPGRAVPLSTAGEIGVNPDQRLHEDARQLSELTADLGIGLFQSTLLLLSFIGVLWGLSRGAAFQVHGTSVDIPGYLVWWALLYAGSASWLSWLVGRPLIRHECRALCARGRPALLPGARQRVRRQHRHLWRRGRRGAPPAPRPRRRARRAAAHRLRPRRACAG